MKLKITSGKREDILKEREEYMAQKAENERLKAEERQRFNEAEYAVIEPIKQYLEDELSYFRALQFDVRVDRGWTMNREGLDVTIRCNENTKFEDDSALSWRFEVKLEYADKEALRAADRTRVKVVKETGSWSGLKATTPAQLKSLRQSVDAIQLLNDIDWNDLLNKDLPKYDDYYKTRPISNREAEFESRLKEVDLEEAIGTNKLVKIHNYESSDYNGRYIYIKIVRESGSQYTVSQFGEWEVDNYIRFRNNAETDDQRKYVEQFEKSFNERYERRMRKSNVRPVMENGSIVTVEVG